MQALFFAPESGIVGAMETLKESECRSCCPVANSLDVLGDRWTLLVIRDLMFTNKHEYSEFLCCPEAIATNILSDRLKRLMANDVIACKPHPKHKTKKLYYLTPKGKDLLPILVELIVWGAAHRATPGMPKARFEKVRRDPKKFMRDTLKQLADWEKINL